MADGVRQAFVLVVCKNLSVLVRALLLAGRIARGRLFSLAEGLSQRLRQDQAKFIRWDPAGILWIIPGYALRARRSRAGSVPCVLRIVLVRIVETMAVAASAALVMRLWERPVSAMSVSRVSPTVSGGCVARIQCAGKNADRFVLPATVVTQMGSA